MEGVQMFPFEIPADLIRDLGYDDFHCPLTGSYVVPGERVIVFRPRRFIALWWEPIRYKDMQSGGPIEGDRLRVFDGQNHMYCRDPQPYLDFICYTEPVEEWIDTNPMSFGDSYREATHWLIIDRDERTGYVAPIETACEIVMSQQIPA